LLSAAPVKVMLCPRTVRGISTIARTRTTRAALRHRPTGLMESSAGSIGRNRVALSAFKVCPALMFAIHRYVCPETLLDSQGKSYSRRLISGQYGSAVRRSYGNADV